MRIERNLNLNRLSKLIIKYKIAVGFGFIGMFFLTSITRRNIRRTLSLNHNILRRITRIRV